MAWSPAMQRDRRKLDFRARLTIENVVRRARNAIPPDGWRKFGAKPLRVFANFDHRCFKGTEVPCAKAWAAPFGVGDVFKVRIARQRAEEVAHMSNAWAWRPTSAAETRMAEPWASSSARRAAPCNHSCSISASEHAPRLQRRCSARFRPLPDQKRKSFSTDRFDVHGENSSTAAAGSQHWNSSSLRFVQTP